MCVGPIAVGVSYGIFSTHPCDEKLKQIVPNQDHLNLFCNTNSKDLCHFMSQVALCFEPGTQFLYGFNFEILGRLVDGVISAAYKYCDSSSVIIGRLIYRITSFRY